MLCPVWARASDRASRPARANDGVDLVQIAHHGVAGKNAADFRMTVDAMEVLITHPDVDVFILVTSDSDYCPAGGTGCASLANTSSGSALTPPPAEMPNGGPLNQSGRRSQNGDQSERMFSACGPF